MGLAVVTGATGLLGSNLALELLAQGHRVRATRRAGSQVDFLEGHPIEWVPGALDDVGALTKACAGADVVFHCAAAVTIRRRPTAETRATNVGGTSNVVAAVRASGAKRLVHCSSTVAVGVSEDERPCTEASRWNLPEHGLDDGYATTKREAELVVLAAVKAGGLDAVVVNPGFMLGPNDARLSSGKLLVAVMKRQVPAVFPGRNSIVDVRDVARGMVQAWEKGRAGERYILAGHTLRYGELGALIAEVGGVPRVTRTVPRWLATLGGRVGDVLEMVSAGEPLVNRCTVNWAYAEGFHFSSEKAKSELGYSFGPVEVALRDALAWLRQRGVLLAS